MYYNCKYYFFCNFFNVLQFEFALDFLKHLLRLSVILIFMVLSLSVGHYDYV